MHGFILICDVTNLSSLREIPDWLQQIETKAQVSEGRQVIVLVNKIDVLDFSASLAGDESQQEI